MSRFYSYINTSLTVIESFNGEKPFAIFIKQYFSANKKYGAKDRRQITNLCFNFFRLGFASTGLKKSEKMLLAFFLCENVPSEFLKRLKPEWNKLISEPLHKKISLVKEEFSLSDIFPFNDELSAGIEPGIFFESLLVQPNLFLRIRPQTKITAFKKLEKSKLCYQLIGEDCVQLPASTNVEDLFIVDKEVVIQDYNSQQVLNFFKNNDIQNKLTNGKLKLPVTAWDCCAASGGKSILLNDIFQRKIEITISDIRPGIILNLHQRFKKAGIKEYKYFIADISQPDFKPEPSSFNLVICDAPCTGSGTWGRTPEQLCYFKKTSITEYSELQRRIVSRAFHHLQAGGIFVYITCSVFKKENELIAGFILEKFDCKLLYQQLLKGYDKKADTMFVAIFEKKLYA